MAEEEIDEELRLLEEEVQAEIKADVKDEKAPRTAVNPEIVGEVVVAAKPAVSTKSAPQPEWQQALFERDYQRMKMSRDTGNDGREDAKGKHTGTEANDPVRNPVVAEKAEMQGAALPGYDGRDYEVSSGRLQQLNSQVLCLSVF